MQNVYRQSLTQRQLLTASSPFEYVFFLLMLPAMFPIQAGQEDNWEKSSLQFQKHKPTEERVFILWLTYNHANFAHFNEWKFILFQI